MTEDQKKPQMVAPEGIPPPDENYVMAARREKQSVRRLCIV